MSKLAKLKHMLQTSVSPLSVQTWQESASLRQLAYLSRTKISYKSFIMEQNATRIIEPHIIRTQMMSRMCRVIVVSKI